MTGATHSVTRFDGISRPKSTKAAGGARKDSTGILFHELEVEMHVGRDHLDVHGAVGGDPFRLPGNMTVLEPSR